MATKGLACAQMSRCCRCSPEDLDKERGAVLEEWRGSKDSMGRTQEASFKFMMDGCKVLPPACLTWGILWQCPRSYEWVSISLPGAMPVHGCQGHLHCI